MNRNIQTFIGCDSSYNESDLVLFGAPFDGTTSFRPGTRFGPSAIRNESFGLETYSPEQDLDLSDYKVCDIGDLELPFGNTKRALQMIRDTADTIFSDGKFPFMLGGEHLISLGLLEAALKHYPDLHIVQLDAHTDLRDEYLGESLSHSTVMRRAFDLLGDGRIHQHGIRSGERVEFQFAKTHTKLYPFDLSQIHKTVNALEGQAVFLTLDLDVLDPSLFSGTGTPEAGGVSYKELMDAILQLSKLNIVTCDINELSPQYDTSGVSTAVACKITREILLSVLKRRR